MGKMIVHVALLDEGTPCWRPAEADHIRDDIYRLRGPIPEDEVWEFQPGEDVRCAVRKSGTMQNNEDVVVAISKVD